MFFPVFIESVAVGDTKTSTGKQTDAEMYPMFCHPEACHENCGVGTGRLKIK